MTNPVRAPKRAPKTTRTPLSPPMNILTRSKSQSTRRPALIERERRKLIGMAVTAVSVSSASPSAVPISSRQTVCARVSPYA